MHNSRFSQEHLERFRNSPNQHPRSATTMTTNNETETVQPVVCHGINDLSGLPALRERVRKYVHNMIQCLPSDHTKAYKEAMEKDPDLVQTETDPLQFVRFAGYDILEGARRLCRYWTERVQLFGRERAFLPLVLTGTGALTPQDLLCLRGGYPALLPDTATGQKCFLLDRRSKVPTATRENMMRCFFYFFKVLAEDAGSQIDGVLALSVVATPRSKATDMDWNYMRQSCALVSNAFPLKFHFHLISVPNKKFPSYATKLVNGTARIVERYFANHSSCTVHVHVQMKDDSPTKIYNILLGLGLEHEGIPLLYNGEWNVERFYDWCQSRMEREQEEFRDRLLGGEEIAFLEPWRRAKATSMKFAAAQKQSPEKSSPVEAEAPKEMTTRGKTATKYSSKEKSTSEEDRKAKQRMEDLLRSRRKRERHRAEFHDLKKDSTRLTNENKRLQAEQQHLQNLLKDAEECVEEFFRM